MAYAQLNSPLPNLTMVFHPGAHALLRGCPPEMGDDWLDPSAIDLPLPTTVDTTALTPIDIPGGGYGFDSTDVPWIGDVFQNVGPDTYLNIQTGQTVPGAVATEIAAATQIPTGVLDTTGTEQGVNLVDASTGTNYSGMLTRAAQLLQDAGHLVDTAGHLTAQGRALAASGQLVSHPVAPAGGAGFSSAIHSLTSWFTEKTLFSAVPNWVVLAGAGVAIFFADDFMQGRYVVRSKKTGKTLWSSKAHRWD